MTTPLTKAERYLFSLCRSTANTIPARRAAIAREGLTGATPATILVERRKAFREFRERKENADLKNLPAWLAAARFEASGDDWRHQSPIPAGRTLHVYTLARLAFDAVDWGKLRKHDRGTATAFPPRVRETDNGKFGMKRVVWRYADYLCVLSPDGQHVAVQVKKGDKIELHAVRFGKFLFRGDVHYTELINRDSRRTYMPKQFVRIVRRFLPLGYDVGIHNGEVCILEQSTGELYHTGSYWDYPSHFVDFARDAFAKRATEKRLAARNAELDAILASQPDNVWVSFADSINAGNCDSQTRAFREQLARELHADGELGAVRASVILSRRNDDYTRRACRAAALRLLRS